MVLGVILNSLFPFTDSFFFELTKVLTEGIVELLDVLVLFPVMDGLRELLESFHWLTDPLI